MTTIHVTADPLMRPVRAFAGTDSERTVAEGICVAVADFPTLAIRTLDGNTVHWGAHLCEVTGEPVAEVPCGKSVTDEPTTTHVVVDLGIAVIHDGTSSIEIDYADIPRIAAELLVAMDQLGDAR